MSEFLHMGGYAAFVWPAYIAVMLVVVVLGVQSWRGQKALTEEAARLKAAVSAGASSGDNAASGEDEEESN